MPSYKVVSIVNEQPTFEKPLSYILDRCEVGGAIKYMSPRDYITDRQRAWYKGVAIPQAVKNDENGETAGWWDDEIKRQCKGLAYLKKDIYFTETTDGTKLPVGRLTTVGVGKKNMTNFIEEILSVSMVKGWNITPPDEDLRR